MLEWLWRALRREPIPWRSRPSAPVSAADEELETVLEKLWIHGGAAIEARGGEGGPSAGRLLPQAAEHKEEQLDEMRDSQSHGCRMVDGAPHFGDQDD